MIKPEPMLVQSTGSSDAGAPIAAPSGWTAARRWSGAAGVRHLAPCHDQPHRANNRLAAPDMSRDSP